jgi:hypothetical protein
MINKLPFIGWILSFVASVSMALPFWLCWTTFGIGDRYFYWLPEVYRVISFWNCVGLFICASIIKGTFIPSFASVSQSNTNKTKGE